VLEVVIEVVLLVVEVVDVDVDDELVAVVEAEEVDEEGEVEK